MPKLILLVLVYVNVVFCEYENCGPGWYYDPVIDSCDTCDSICDHAFIQGTVQDCLNNCPGHLFGTSPTSTTTVPPVRPGSDCADSRRTVTVLLVSLIGVSVLLLGMTFTVVLMVTRTRVTLQDRRLSCNVSVPLVNIRHSEQQQRAAPDVNSEQVLVPLVNRKHGEADHFSSVNIDRCEQLSSQGVNHPEGECVQSLNTHHGQVLLQVGDVEHGEDMLNP